MSLHRQAGFTPAIRLAREGSLITPRKAYMVELLTPILTLFEAGRALYTSRGRPVKEGERFLNPDLAEFLEELPEGGEQRFYDGEIARQVACDMRQGGGLLTEADLAAFQVIERTPLAVGYRGHRLLTNPAPAFGGSLLGLSLHLLETQDLSATPWRSAEHVCPLAAVMQEADDLRSSGCLAAADLAAGRRGEAAGRIRRSTRGTTHLSVADAEGNVASMTTSNGEGSAYIVPGTGIMLNNMMGEDDLHPDGFHAMPAGERVASMMSPSLMLSGQDVRLVVGSGGSKRIRTALLQVISHVVDFGVSVPDAVEAPRLHWDGECVQVEPGFPAAAVDALRRRWAVNVWSAHNLYFGGVNAVTPDGEAGADSRRGGNAVVLD